MIDFESALYEENEKLRQEAIEKRDKEIQERVDEIWPIIDDKESFAKYDVANEDPFVQIALNRRVNESMMRDQTAEIFKLNHFLKSGKTIFWADNKIVDFIEAF